MPIYEYVCTKCGAESEAIQKFSDAPLVKCDSCNKRGLVRKMSRSAFHLQGGGWFAGGYDGGAGNGTKKATEAAKDSKSSGDGAATTKPAASSAPTPPPAAASA